MSNRAEAIVDLSAIAANVKMLKAAAGTELMAVVKADAYGHGLVPVAKAALEAGASWLGVALVEEAHSLRSAGITSPILAWLMPPGSDYAAAIDANIDIAVPSLDILNEVIATGKKARIHIEVDTGMTRGGFLNEWPELYKNLPILNNKGVAVAPWNLNNYKVSKSKHTIKIDNADLQFFHFHGLEIGFISKWIAIYIPASGYELHGNQGMPIYKAYIRELMNQLRHEPNLRPASKKRSLEWWIKSILRNRIKMRLYC